MAKFLSRISSKIFPKLSELEEKVNKLDPKGIAGTFNEAIGKIDQFKKETRQELDKAVDEKTKGFSDRFHAIQSRLADQDKKIDEFVSLTQKTTQKVLSRISDLLKEISALIGEESKEGKDEGAKG